MESPVALPSTTKPANRAAVDSTSLRFPHPDARPDGPDRHREGGSSPGTAHEASSASTSAPSVNQCSVARSMLAATHWNGTGSSARVRTGRCLVSRSRSGSRECRCVRARASVRARLRMDRRKFWEATPLPRRLTGPLCPARGPRRRAHR